MNPEEIDAELAKAVGSGLFPRTIADALAFVFTTDPTFRGTIDGQRGVTDADITHLKFTVSLNVHTVVAQAHLRRLQAVEARGEPGEHELFKKP